MAGAVGSGRPFRFKYAACGVPASQKAVGSGRPFRFKYAQVVQGSQPASVGSGRPFRFKYARGVAKAALTCSVAATAYHNSSCEGGASGRFRW